MLSLLLDAHITELQLLDLVAPDDLGEDGGEMAGAKTSVPEVEMSDGQDRQLEDVWRDLELGTMI